MQRTIHLALVLGATTFPAISQDQTPVFSADTTLIEFTVTAIDKRGNPVTDLKKEEIVVEDEGRRRKLALFRYEGGEQLDVAPELPPGVFTNTPELTPGPPRNITAIVLDTFNTQPREQAWVKKQVARFVSDLLPDARLAVYLLGQDLTILHDFTDDADSLQERIEQVQVALAAPTLGWVKDMGRDLENYITWMQRQQMSESMIKALVNLDRRGHESADEQRIRNTLALLETLGDHLSGIPGRKSVAWFGGGFPMLSITGSLEFDTPGGIRSYETLIERTTRRMAQQGITMYMFDARGMQLPVGISAKAHKASPASTGRTSPYERVLANAAISSDPVPAMSKIADITGGRYYWNTNDVGRAVDDIIADSRGTYSLGFYTDSDDEEKWRSLKVRVARKGVNLKYRDGYMSSPPPAGPLEWTDEQWLAAVYNPVTSTAVGLDALLQMDITDDDAKTVTMTMQVLADDLHFRQIDDHYSATVDVAIVDKLPDAQHRMKLYQEELLFPDGDAAAMGVVQIPHNWELKPGTTTVRLIVRDRLTGRYGSLDAPVENIPQAENKEITQ